ncbi:unnamed protein product [Brassicogethes aeneus]|uniref:Major facilitator superfamily (MFS) profile domain-containing protein n=1 Tax=Brassicogethes aeneus TaxID=1431903 RepID=A0A9P0AYA8_BRAAE|nr:unnamed protein product [Brassicogethes aeneus]
MKIEQRLSKDFTAPQHGKEWPQICAIFISSLASLCCGLAFSWFSPSLPVIISDKENYDITEDQASYFTVLPPATMMLSVPLFSSLNDRIGRKKVIMIMGVIQIVAWSLVSVANNVYVFYLSRCVNGLGDGCLFTALPMYIGEVSNPKVRGRWGNILTFNIYFGQCLINIIGSNFSIVHTAYIVLVVPIVFLVIFYFFPESPYYLVMKGKEEEAKAALKWLTRKDNIEEDFLQLKYDVARQMSETGTWCDLFKNIAYRKALYAGLFLRISQQLGGISVFAIYTQFIFAKAGTNMSPSNASIIFTGLICILNFIAGFTIDKFGRRPAYMVSSFFSGVVLFLLSCYFYIDDYQIEIDLSSFKWVPLAGMMVFVFTYSFGLGVVPTLMLGELFSASIKSKGLCFLTIIFGVLVGSLTKLFHILESNYGLFCPFLLFSLSSLIGTILTVYFVPETKGKTLEEIQQALKGEKKEKKNEIL